MEKQLSDTVEDYIKVIYNLSTGNDRVSTGRIAAELGVSPASVTDMLQRLAGDKPPLLDYQK
ncbi:MAG: metal-dependent transcriptional regulator, partial [Anaerolineales bacterium]